jgi:HAD superfamily hydrolase (TIGR01509 family)
MIQGIIFDFDGVLVDSEQVNIDAAIKTFQELGKPLTPQETASIPGISSMDFIPVFSKKRGIDDPAEHQRLYEINRANYNMLWENVVTMPDGAKDTIETLLSQNKKLAIATTNLLETVEMFLKKFGMHNIFSIIVTGENVKRRKPDPEVYLLAIEQLNLPKQNIVAVEDTTIGLRAAKGAGIRCVIIPSEHTKKDDFSGADFIFPSMRDLLNID